MTRKVFSLINSLGLFAVLAIGAGPASAGPDLEDRAAVRLPPSFSSDSALPSAPDRPVRSTALQPGITVDDDSPRRSERRHYDDRRSHRGGRRQVFKSKLKSGFRRLVFRRR